MALLLVATAFAANAQQPKNIVYDPNAEARTVGDFHGVQVSGGVALYLSQGSSNGVAVSTDDAKDVVKVKTEVKDGILKIFLEKNGGLLDWKSRRVKAYVTVKNLDRIDASGASAVIVTDKITADDFKLELSGASSFKGDLGVASFKLSLTGASSLKGTITASAAAYFDISGASAATIAGSTAKADIHISGASTLKGFDFIIESCNTEASGASSANITISKALKAEASGASNIRYGGEPSTINVESSGASSVKKRIL